MNQPVCFFNKRVMKLPLVLFAATIAWAALSQNWWLLFSFPPIYLGWVCSAPNLNLADGCFPQLSLPLALLFILFGWVTLSAIMLSFWLSWLLCSLELAWRCQTGRTGVAEDSNNGNSHSDKRS